MYRERRETPTMTLGNRDASESAEEVTTCEHDREGDDRCGQPQILGSPPEDQRKG